MNSPQHRRAPRLPVLVMQLKGTQEEMGHQQAEILKSQGGFEEIVNFYPSMVQKLILGGLPKALRTDFSRLAITPLIEMGLSNLERNRIPAYQARHQALARTAGFGPDKAKYFHVMDIFQNSIGWLGGMGVLGEKMATSLAIPACTSAVVWGGKSASGVLRHARNFDFPGVGVWDEAPVVIFCTPESGLKYGFISTRGADTPGISAFNEAGITVTFHTRFHRDINMNGLGVLDLGHEIIRKASTLNEAFLIASELGSASTWGITVSSAEEKTAGIIETNGRKVRLVPAFSGEEFLVNTNHYLTCELQEGEVSPGASFHAHTLDRYLRMRELVSSGRSHSTADMQSFLADHCDYRGQKRAMGSTLAQLTTVMSMVSVPEEASIHVANALAPASWGPYLKIPIRWENSPGVKILEADSGRAVQVAASSPEAEAYGHFKNAYLADLAGGDHDEVESHLNRAVQLQPADSSYRFMASIVNLQMQRPLQAMGHLMSALQVEKNPSRRAQGLYWGSRLALSLGQDQLHRRYRDELRGISHPGAHAWVSRAGKLRPLNRMQMSSLVAQFLLIDAA